VADEARNYSGLELDLSDWTDHSPADIPQQANGYDCGVFTCKVGYSLLLSCSRFLVLICFAVCRLPQRRERAAVLPRPDALLSETHGAGNLSKAGRVTGEDGVTVDDLWSEFLWETLLLSAQQ
jgi:hypothetical protein